MEDKQILEAIGRLVHEEQGLESDAGSGGLDDDGRARLHNIEASLDQCWDLLRQRRARRSAGLDPDEAAVRAVDTVEDYEQ
jgi:hypothetical protein